MRLTCPNCGAQYEVPEDVIPPEGRDVQCSNCSSTWFQAHSDSENSSEAAPQTPEPDEQWQPEIDAQPDLQSDPEPVAEPAPADPAPSDAEAVTMTAEATDEALAAAVKAAVRRARPDHIQAASEQAAEQAAPVVEEKPTPAPNELDSFENDLDARMTEWGDIDAPVPADVFPPKAEPEEPEMPTPARRRELDPAVADVLREEAALENARRAEETPLESQPDLGLDEPVLDDAATRAKQAKERMARMRGVTVDEMDAPQEEVPLNSRRDLLPDIEEINSTLRATEDRSQDEQPDGRPTASQRRAGGRRIGFALALLVIAGGVYTYVKPDQLSQLVPESERYVSAFVNLVDTGRLKLDGQMTKLMLWLDKIASGAQ